MGYGDVSCLNPESKINTKCLDRLAQEGMKFTDAHASSSVCTPSRYSILTGRYNWRSALKSGVLMGRDGPLIEEGRLTVASYLREQGYRTACLGKWHLGWEWGRQDDNPDALDFSKPVVGGPVDRGFDSFFGIIASLDIPPYVWVRDDRPTTTDVRWLDAEKEGYVTPGFMRSGELAADLVPEEVTPELTRRACEYIRERRNDDKPYFLYLPLPSPHTPILPGPFTEKSGTNAYGDFCLMVDDCIGQVMQAVEASGKADDTIVIFTSDNGCSPMADMEALHAMGHRPSYVFRGAKADIYEGGHRIPLLVKWPATINAGTQCDDTVCLSDLLTTMAEIVGESLPDNAGEDSVSNLPLWHGREEEVAPIREATVHHSIDGSFSIRQGRWKLEFCPGSGGWSYPEPGKDDTSGMPPIQLYDLEADIGERTNVQDRHPDVVEHLTKLMTQYVRSGRSTPGTPQSNTGPRYWPQLNWMMENG
jgi:arylsulfatase A-like enzyme